jgi:ribosomal-protein-serine acetyltransferase
VRYILNLPETIEGKVGNAARRNHSFDNQLFSVIESSRNFLRKYLFWVDGTKSIKDVQESTKMFMEIWDKAENYAYIITDKKNNAVGVIDFHNIDYKNHSGEFGYWLAENANRKGYVSEMIQILEKMLFEKGMVRLVIKCDEENTASNNVAKRNGYNFEGTAVKDTFAYGKYRNSNIYAKTK